MEGESRFPNLARPLEALQRRGAIEARAPSSTRFEASAEHVQWGRDPRRISALCTLPLEMISHFGCDCHDQEISLV